MSDSSSKSGKSWSLRNMLGKRGTAAKDATKAKTKTRKSTKEEMECTTSIKERVLAKLREPLPELKQGARHSSVEAFSPRLCSSYESNKSEERESYTPSRYSTSSYQWKFEEPATSSSYTTTTTYQASLSPCSSHYYSNRCSSPTSTNVIARLMGLEDASDATNIKPTPVSSPRIKKSRAADTATSRSSWIQDQSPRPIAGSPRDNIRTAQSPKTLVECNGFSSRNGSRRDSAQDFLDEMEDHLKQCDRALERIEAVMELKKKLLYLNRTSPTSSDHAYSSSSRVKHRQDVYKTSTDVDSSSYQYCTRDFSQAVNDTFIQMTTSRHSKMRHSRANSMDQILKRYEDFKEVEPPASRTFQHRRSVSDGETPVFRPGAFDLEQDFSNRSRELHKESFRKWESLQWDHPKTPEHKVMELRAHSHPAKSNMLKTLFEQQKQQQTVLQHKQIADSNSEQPSPVSVLDNIQDDSSEDDRDSSHKETKKNVKRALWTTPSPTPADIAQTAAIKSVNAANQAAAASSSPNEAINDTDLLRRLDRTWATGIRMETAQLAVMIECIIFRGLVEDTLKCLQF